MRGTSIEFFHNFIVQRNKQFTQIVSSPLSSVQKLEEYLNGVREVERRIDLSSETTDLDLELDYPVPKGTPSDYGEHIRLMCDMMVLAFQMDRTRIATFMLADAGRCQLTPETVQ